MTETETETERDTEIQREIWRERWRERWREKYRKIEEESCRTKKDNFYHRLSKNTRLEKSKDLGNQNHTTSFKKSGHTVKTDIILRYNISNENQIE